MGKTFVFLPIPSSDQLHYQPKTQPTRIHSMSEEIQKPEAVSDEQLEDVAGGTFDNNSCNALIEATVIVG